MPMADVPSAPYKRSSTLATGSGYLFSTGLLSSDEPCEIGQTAWEKQGPGDSGGTATSLKFPIYTTRRQAAEAPAYTGQARNLGSTRRTSGGTSPSHCHDTPRSLASPRGVRQADRGKAKRNSDAFSRLHNEHYARLSRHEEKKNDLLLQRIGEEETVLKECTFEPNVSRRGQQPANGNRTWQRLYTTETQATLHAHRSKQEDGPSPGPGSYQGPVCDAPPTLGQTSNGATAPIPLLKQAQKGSEKSSQASSTGTSGSRGKPGGRGAWLAKKRNGSPRRNVPLKRLVPGLKLEKTIIEDLEPEEPEPEPEQPTLKDSTTISAKICDMSDLVQKEPVEPARHHHTSWDSMTLSSSHELLIGDTPPLGPATRDAVRPFAAGKCIDCGQALPSELPYCPATGREHITTDRSVSLKEPAHAPIINGGMHITATTLSCLSADDTDLPTAVDRGSIADTDDTSVRMLSYGMALQCAKASGINKTTKEILQGGGTADLELDAVE